MKRIMRALAALLCCAATVCGQVPQGYYDRLDGESGNDLKDALYSCINSHRKLSYGDLWDYYPLTDVVLGTDDQVRDLYSDEVHHYGDAGLTSAMNKEHTVPKSWWGGSGTHAAASDIHHVLPSNSKANSAKSNYPLGIVTGKVTFDNGVSRVGKSDNSGGCGSVFEPADRYKGDFARMYFYVATCYPRVWGSTAYAMENTSATLKPWVIDMLLQWHEADPVDDAEIHRNDAVYGVQQNRNPFVDFPELAEYIWGRQKAETFVLAHHKPTSADDYKPGTPDDPGTPDTPDEPNGPDTPDTPTQPVEGDVLLAETFDCITVGNSTASTGSNTEWEGNDNFPTVSKAYRAGGAVRIGTSKATGSITSRTIDVPDGRVVVEFDVKGWTAVEGVLYVTVGSERREVEYSATMTDGFEHITLDFDNVPQHTTVAIATSAKRAFIDNVTVTARSGMETSVAAPSAHAYYTVHTLDGRSATGNMRQLTRGIYIVNGRKVVIR